MPMSAFSHDENSLIQVIDLAFDPIYLCNGIHVEYLCTVSERTHAHLQMKALEAHPLQNRIPSLISPRLLNHIYERIDCMKYTKFLLIGLAVVLSSTIANSSGGDSHKAKGKDAFRIEMKHTKEECLNALDEMMEKDVKLLNKVEWGCMVGDHRGWVTLSAKSEEDAKNLLPASARANASVVKVSKFTADQIRSFHKH